MKLEELLAYAAAPAAALIGMLAGRRRNNAAAEKGQVDSVKEVISIYKEAAEEIVKKYDSLKADFGIIRQENQSMRKEIKILREENSALRREIGELKNLMSKGTVSPVCAAGEGVVISGVTIDTAAPKT